MSYKIAKNEVQAFILLKAIFYNIYWIFVLFLFYLHVNTVKFDMVRLISVKTNYRFDTY